MASLQEQGNLPEDDSVLEDLPVPQPLGCQQLRAAHGMGVGVAVARVASDSPNMRV